MHCLHIENTVLQERDYVPVLSGKRVAGGDRCGAGHGAGLSDRSERDV